MILQKYCKVVLVLAKSLPSRLSPHFTNFLVKGVLAFLIAFGSHASLHGQSPSADPYSTSGYNGPVTYSGPGLGGMTNIFTSPPTWLSSARWQGSNLGVGGGLGSLLGVEPQDRLWLRGEYLHWWTEGMNTPALATTSTVGTPQNQAGILGLNSTSVLFGGGEINDDSTSGMRFRGGFYVTPSAAFGIEGEYFSLGEQDDGFSGGTGQGILARPFFRTDTDIETAQLIDYPGSFDGNLQISSETKLRSMLIAGRASLCPTCGGNCVACRNTDRVDWIVGYRHLQLKDGLAFSESIESFVPGELGTLQLSESFRTKNEFNGLQLGVAYQANLKRVWLESLLRVAVGTNRQSVGISGNTSITELGITETFAGGLLAQRFNSGSFEREDFTMVPEIGLTLGVRIFDWMHATAGYSLVYLPAVVRAGDQIDTDINPNLLAPPLDPFTGAARPQFRYIESDYYAQGLSLGLQLQF